MYVSDFWVSFFPSLLALPPHFLKFFPNEWHSIKAWLIVIMGLLILSFYFFFSCFMFFDFWLPFISNGIDSEKEWNYKRGGGLFQQWRTIPMNNTPSGQLPMLSFRSLGMMILMIWVPSSSSTSNPLCLLTLIVWRLVKLLGKVHVPLFMKDCRFLYLSFSHLGLAFFLLGFSHYAIWFNSRFTIVHPTVFWFDLGVIYAWGNLWSCLIIGSARKNKIRLMLVAMDELSCWL